jgi:Zn-dependent peptidase ImmA (M78 family)
MGDGPIVNLTQLLESKGLVVGRFSLGADTLDAFGAIAPEAPIVIENTDRTNAVRMRFDVAHELAHMTLHRHTPTPTTPEIHKLMEHQAHRFAGAFLFPASSFANEVYSVTISGLLDAKRRWGLSIQMMTRRAFDLGLISDYQYGRAFRTLSAKGFRAREPLDDALVSEEPSTIQVRLRKLVEEQGLTARDVESHVQQYSREIEALSSLPPGYFDAFRVPPPGARTLRAVPRQRA